MKSKTLIRTSIFPASARTVFNKLKSIQTLQYIASPYATFAPLNESRNFNWKAGRIFTFRLKILGIIPFGIHTINVISFNEETCRISTTERNAYVPIWNHTISLIPLSDDASQYTDEVEICAGWKTPFVYLWAKLFYAHRQKKWLTLLSPHDAL